MDDTSHMPLRIVYVSIQSIESTTFCEPAETVCRDNGWDLDLFCANSTDIDSDPLLYHELVHRTRSASLLL